MIRIRKHLADKIRDVQNALVQADLLTEAKRCFHASGENRPGDSNVVDCYALAMEALRRIHAIELYSVQVEAAVAMRQNCCVEMRTGEGKTFTSVLPIVFYAMQGKGCHVVTANDYLVQRDSQLLKPVFGQLGLTVGAVVTDCGIDQRRLEYQRDITYTTAAQLGFDFLKDELAVSAIGPSGKGRTIQRGRHAAIVDEADYTLIDEARTPLVLATSKQQSDDELSVIRWADQLSGKLCTGSFISDARKRTVTLTKLGCQRAIVQRPPGAARGNEGLFRALETSLQAKLFYHRDKEYVLQEGQIVLIDEHTGRSLQGRRWQLGLHQAVEAKEGLEVSTENADAARISIQQLFGGYQHLVGMTGTTKGAENEFKKLYRMKVRLIPTHRPNIRNTHETTVWSSTHQKWEYVRRKVVELINQSRPVLIGTVSVLASESLSALFREANIPHSVLNARQNGNEAEIVSQAGGQGVVTIATNMAGRGTDIPLSTSAKKAGGLHVIATEVAVSQRVDRQLIGRCARQGDPGSCEVTVSIEDDLLRHANQSQRDQLGALNCAQKGDRIRAMKIFIKIQRRIEQQHRNARHSLQKTEKELAEQAKRHGLNPFVEMLRPS